MFSDPKNKNPKTDFVDAIGGWTTSGIGQKYGAGYDLNVKYKWMKKIEVQGSGT